MTELQILDLRACESSSPQRCGDKGAALGALMGEAMPVPAGFVVTTMAFSSFLAIPGLSSIHRQLQRADRGRSAALAEELRSRVLATDLPRSLEEEVSRKLDQYRDGYSTRWAVRSSPLEEGAQRGSNTRRSDTVLGASTAEVATAIRRVWSSAFDEQTVRRREDLKWSEVRMAVVVQKLLHPETAGTCRTLDWMQREDRMFVYANYGLGESVARGTVMPDTHVVDRRTHEPVMDIVGSKRMQVVACAGGIAETGVPADKQRRFCLSPQQVAEVAKLAKAVETLQGNPVDIDWAYEDGKLYLLLARSTRASGVSLA